MNIPFDDVVTKKEIEQELEYANEGWKAVFSMYFRLTHQQAPPELVAEMTRLNELYKEITDRLKNIQNCFPPSP